MPETKITPEKDSIPFYPDHIRTELLVMGGLLIGALIIGALGLFFPVGTGEPADPMNTPAHVKPEWYFLSLYQLLKFIPKTIGAVIPVIAVILIAIWPFIDRKAEVSKRNRNVRIAVVVLLLIAFIALTIWGEVS